MYRSGTLRFGGTIIMIVRPVNAAPEYVIELPCGIIIRTSEQNH